MEAGLNPDVMGSTVWMFSSEVTTIRSSTGFGGELERSTCFGRPDSSSGAHFFGLLIMGVFRKPWL